jgi:hypothetical protein
MSTSPVPLSLRLTSLLPRVVLIAMAIVSIGTCFSALSQYPTHDQPVTVARLQRFVNNVDAVVLNEGSLVSDLVVAPAAYSIRAVLDKVFRPGELIAWEIHYTRFLPFAVAQVIVALGLVLLLSALLVRMARGALDLDAVLLTAVVLLNFPMLKALVKVVKYDALTTLLSAVAVALYVGRFRRQAGSQALGFDSAAIGATAVFCALAFLEKDTAISIAMLVVFVELAVIPITVPGIRSALARAAGFVAIFVATFALTTMVLVPKVLRDPGRYPELFDAVGSYFVNVPVKLAVVIAGFMVVAYIGVPIIRSASGRFHWVAVAPKLLLGVSVVGIVSATGAFIFQDNVIYDATIADNDIAFAISQDKSIFVSKPMAGAAMTTLDHSAMVQGVKMFHSMARVIFYTLPEVFVVMIVGAAPLFLLLARAEPDNYAKHAGPFLLLLPIAVGLLVAYSLGGVSVEAKYLVLATLLLLMYGLYPVLLLQQRLASQALPAVFALVTVLTVLPAGPTYFGYKNILRSRELENAAALDMNRVVWWTWAGWGETVYPIGRYLEANRRGPVTVAHDNLPPFHSDPGVRWVDAGFDGCRTLAQLKSTLARLGAESVDFLVVSKARSSGNWCLNQILRRMRTAAVFVDEQQGFEYGWLFRRSDVSAAFGSRESLQTPIR